jgi:hypothetical protein
MLYRHTPLLPGNGTFKEKQKVASNQALIRASACAVVDKLNSGEVTPLDLLDVL